MTNTFRNIHFSNGECPCGGGTTHDEVIAKAGGGFYELDEDPAEVLAAFDSGIRVVTGRPMPPGN